MISTYTSGLCNHLMRLGISMPGTRTLFLSNSQALVGLNSSARSTMLPPNLKGGTDIPVPANALPEGSTLMVQGIGLIGAASLMPGAFNLIPWVKPVNGTKTDLPGFSKSPLLGADGICEIWLMFSQTSTGILTSGITRYGTDGGMAYSISINPGTTSTLPTVIASDPTVDRVFGVDGQWATANVANYVRCRQVVAAIFTNN